MFEPDPNKIATDSAVFETARSRMVAEQIVRRGVRDAEVLRLMAQIPRHLFVPDDLVERAYEDSPLPIGFQQTISQPYIVASMTEHLQIQKQHRVLEIGTGSGYQTAVLSALGAEVYSVELEEVLSHRAEKLLSQLGFGKVQFRVGDGRLGWPEEAPFDRILVAATASDMPAGLVSQLGPNGRMIIPVRDTEGQEQWLTLVTRDRSTIVEERLYSVRFVPLRSPDCDQ
ncbi:MAG: protein-L-isoaspartate(D-aspartate) O-methyltransferase [Candidatus Zixiibacteriota bacterium]